MASGSGSHLERLRTAFRRRADQTWALPYRGVEIGSAYQPIYALSTGMVMGHEALLRNSDPTLDPGAVFQVARYHFETLDLSDSVRILHLCNYAVLEHNGETRLFLPSLTETLGNPSKATALGACIASLELSPARVVLDLPVKTLDGLSDEVLESTLRPFRELGCAIAVSGCDGSNLGRARSLHPDFVSVDASRLRATNPASDRSLPLAAICRSLRSSGIQTLGRGIGSRAELERARAAGLQNGQGFYLRPPEQYTVAMEPAAVLI